MTCLASLLDNCLKGRYSNEECEPVNCRTVDNPIRCHTLVLEVFVIESSLEQLSTAGSVAERGNL